MNFLKLKEFRCFDNLNNSINIFVAIQKNKMTIDKNRNTVQVPRLRSHIGRNLIIPRNKIDITIDTLKLAVIIIQFDL